MDKRRNLALQARLMLESVEHYDGLADVLREHLPRLIDPRDETGFEAAVEALAARLDEPAIHQLERLIIELRGFQRQPVPVPAEQPYESTTLRVASYVASRPDATIVRAFEHVRARWRSRAKTDDHLREEEAVDLATAAACTLGYAAEHLHVLETQASENGEWLVRMRADDDGIRVVVPPGDPGQAQLLIEAPRRL
jgi:hypothetical protein